MPAARTPSRTKVKQSLADKAYQQLEEMIVTLKLPPGSMHSETALSDLVKIGRTPVREAARKLADAHLAEILPRHGIRISYINVQEQLLALEVRRELERLVATRAARRALPSEKMELPAMAQAMEDAGNMGDVIGYLRSLFVADQVLVKCARNAFCAEAIAPLHALSRRFYFVHHKDLNDLKIVGRHHADVARAVAAGDEIAAAKAADRMMDYVEKFTRDTITRDFAPAPLTEISGS